MPGDRVTARPGFSPALVIMAALLICATATQLFAALSWGHESWQLGDWLINYAGGFVRRGLTGTLVQLVSGATGLQPNYVVILASLACYCLLALWFLHRCAGYFPAALVLSCVVMGFPAYQDGIVRKDCLCLLLFLGCVRADGSTLPPVVRFMLVNLLAALAIFSHEGFAFYALPALAIFVTRDDPRPFLLRGLVLLPAAGCLLLSIIFHGTPEIANAVNDSWLPLWQLTNPGNPAVGDPIHAIEALGWSSGKGLSLSTYLLTSGFYQPAAWAFVYAVSFALVVLFTGRGEAGIGPKIRITALLLMQLVFVSPLFLLGVDYGRWLFFWVASSMILHIAGRRAPAFFENVISRIFERAALQRFFDRVPARDWYLLFFGVPVIWNIHNFLTASPVARHFEILRSWL